MKSILKSLQFELNKTTDDIVKRNLRNSIYFIMKAIEHIKLMDKKSERKIKQVEKEADIIKKEALKDIEKKRHKIR